MKYKKFYIIILSILLISYMFWFYELNFCTINQQFLESIILFIPIFLIILNMILLKNKKIKDIFGIVITCSLLVMFVMMNFFILIFAGLEEGTSYENNPLRYKHIYNIAGYKEYTYQFPKEIPQDILNSNNVKFFYSPQFLQGGFNLELILKMDNKDINEYIERFSGRVIKEIEVNNENKYELTSYGIYEPRWLFENNGYNEFLRDAKFYILASEPYKTDDWNHGYVQYIAKNESLKQMLIVTQIW